MINDQYLPLEVNLTNDKRIHRLVNKYGMRGFGAFMSIIIELRRQDNYSIDFETLNGLSRTCGESMEFLSSVVYDFRLFELKEEEGETTITSEYLNRVMERLEEKREKCRKAGKKSAETRTRSTIEHPLNGRSTVKKSKEEKSKEDTTGVVEKSTTTPITITPSNNWEFHLTEAIKEKQWLEILAMHTGFGMEFLTRKDYLLQLFKEHVLLQGTAHRIQSLRDAKSYLANFFRPGTPTHKDVRARLQLLLSASGNKNPYRHEDVDPASGHRSYYGLLIPSGAPPRPGENSVWSNELQQWS